MEAEKENRTMNNPEVFPKLNEPVLCDYAEKWAREAPEPIKRITLRRYQSKYGKMLAKSGSITAYTVIFELAGDEPVDREEPAPQKTIHDYLYIYQTADEPTHLLPDIFREEVYKTPAGAVFRNEWEFTTKALIVEATLYRSEWILYEAPGTLPFEFESLWKEAKQEVETVYEALMEVGLKMPDSMLHKAAAAAVQPGFKYIRKKHIDKLFRLKAGGGEKTALATGKERRDFIGKIFKSILTERKFETPNYQVLYDQISKIR
jgi:hypothetical protein